jgi:hypothetical protein
MHINVQAHSNIYAQGIAIFEDRWQQPQSTCIVSEMRCMVRTLPTVARLQAVDREVMMSADGTATCRLRLERTPLFDGPLTITLDDASSAGLAAEPQTIAAGQSEIVLQMRRRASQLPAKPAALHFVGRGELAGGTVVVTEATVHLKWPDK